MSKTAPEENILSQIDDKEKNHSHNIRDNNISSISSTTLEDEQRNIPYNDDRESDDLTESRSVQSDKTDNRSCDRESVASDRESVAGDRESVASDRESVASDRESVASDRESVASDRESVASRTENYKQTTIDRDSEPDTDVQPTKRRQQTQYHAAPIIEDSDSIENALDNERSDNSVEQVEDRNINNFHADENTKLRSCFKKEKGPAKKAVNFVEKQGSDDLNNILSTPRSPPRSPRPLYEEPIRSTATELESTKPVRGRTTAFNWNTTFNAMSRPTGRNTKIGGVMGGAPPPARGRVSLHTQKLNKTDIEMLRLLDTEHKENTVKAKSFRKKNGLGDDLGDVEIHDSDEEDEDELAHRQEVIIRSIIDKPATKWYIIHPEVSHLMIWWKTLITITLIALVTVTPYEIAFGYQQSLQLPVQGWFYYNRILDLIFIIDFILNFITMVPQLDGSYVSDPKLIRKHYFQGYFPTDAISLLPWDLVALYIGKDRENTYEQHPISLIKCLRCIRVTRLILIIKHLRSQASLHHGSSQQKLRLMESVGRLVLVAHWGACLFGLIGTLQRGIEITWISTLAQTEAFEDHAPTGVDLYFSALYWSIYSITSVGYGDITPTNTIERAFCCCMLIIFAGFWASVLGTATVIMQSLDHASTEFYKKLDFVNATMKSQKFDKDTERRIRTFIVRKHTMQGSKNIVDIMSALSPVLQNEVAMKLYGNLLCKIPYFSRISTSCLKMFVLALDQTMHAQTEKFGWIWTLYVLIQGSCIRNATNQITSLGTIWGEDFVLKDISLTENPQAYALTYCEVMELPRNSLYEVASHFPELEIRVRRYCVCTAVRRGILREAFNKQMEYNKTGRSSQDDSTQNGRIAPSDAKRTNVLKRVTNFVGEVNFGPPSQVGRRPSEPEMERKTTVARSNAAIRRSLSPVRAMQQAGRTRNTGTMDPGLDMEMDMLNEFNSNF